MKALQDQSQQDAKLKKYLGIIIKNIRILLQNEITKEKVKETEGFVLEIEDFLEKLSLNEFSLNGIDRQIFDQVKQDLKKKEEGFLNIQTSIEHLEKQYRELDAQEEKGREEKRNLEAKLQEILKQIASIDPQKLEGLKKEKAKYYEETSQLEEEKDYSAFSQFLRNEEVTGFLGNNEVKNLQEAREIIQKLKQAGKDLQGKVSQIDLEIKNIQLQTQQTQKDKEYHIQQIKEQEKYLQEQLVQAQRRLQEFDGTIEEQSIFACEKIGTNCPFIKVINKQHFEQLDKQKQSLFAEVETLQEQVKKADFAKKREILEQEEKSDSSALLKEKEFMKSETEKLMEIMRNFLMEIGFKEIEESYQNVQEIGKKIQHLDQQILSLESAQSQLQSYQQKETEIRTSLINIEKQTKEREAKKILLKEEVLKLKEKLEQQGQKEVVLLLRTVEELLQSFDYLQQLIEDATATKNLVKDLQQQEKMLGSLYTILSKEILLLALDEYLPVLNEIINSYLAQVVGYQISMKIVETTEKLELEAKIFDEKGEREVKSLS